jgi:hypothetical protein
MGKAIGSSSLINTHRRKVMSQALASLKLVNAKRENTVDITQFRRSKLNEKLKVQIEMAKALSRGEQFTIKRKKLARDEATGQTTLIEVDKRLKTWWFTNNETKRVAVQLFYGNKELTLSAKGDKNAVEVSNGDELIATLLKLQEAVLDGSLDAQIAVAADSVKARFSK